MFVQIARGSGDELIEYVIVPLSCSLTADPRRLQKIVGHESTGDTSVLGKVDLNKLSESTRIVVSERFGISKRLKDRVSLQKSLLDGSGFCAPVLAQVAEHCLLRFGFSGSRLSGHDDRL